MSCSAAPTSRRISRASACGTWGRAALSVSSWRPTLTQVRPFPTVIPHQPGTGHRPQGCCQPPKPARAPKSPVKMSQGPAMCPAKPRGAWRGCAWKAGSIFWGGKERFRHITERAQREMLTSSPSSSSFLLLAGSSHVLHGGGRPGGPAEADPSFQEENHPGEEASAGARQIHGFW